MRRIRRLLVVPHKRVADSAAAITESNRAIANAADLREPAAQFPLARRLGPRRITLHIGPTNSGKTHAALEALKNCNRGLYCSPLRLLAWEVFEKMIAAGKPCELVTGQEREAWEPPRDVAPRAGERRRGGLVIASTVECASIDTVSDVCVLDEIQLLGDPHRGWAWSRVFLGVPAADLHLCGDPASETLVRRLAELSGDTVEVVRYTRLSPLAIAPTAVRTWRDLQSGDCVVAFSRRELFATSRAIETTTGFRTSIIYGGLPPEVRREQARCFNGEEESGGAPPSANILVASDAIGMGLNLRIRRVIFSTLAKFDGTSRRDLTPSEIRQIGGRAGRFGGAFSEGGGEVTAVESRHLGTLRKALSAETPTLEKAALAPTLTQLIFFAVALAPRFGLLDESTPRGEEGPAALASRVASKAIKFSSLIRLFAAYAQIDEKSFFLSDHEEMARAAELVDDVPLDFRDRYMFALAPVHLDDPLNAAALRRYAQHFAKRGRVTVGLRVPDTPPRTPEQVATLEAVYRVFDLYCWLARVYSVEFCYLLNAVQRAKTSAELITQGLEKIGKENVAAAISRAHLGRFGPGSHGTAHDTDFLRTMIDDDRDRESEDGDSGWWNPDKEARGAERRMRRGGKGGRRTVGVDGR